MQAMQAKWKNDKFEVILRKVNSASSPEWRIKCLDCPGKVERSLFFVFFDPCMLMGLGFAALSAWTGRDFDEL
jgi:hypothetical protein